MAETELFQKLGTVPVDDAIPVGNDRRANINHVFRDIRWDCSSHKEAPRVVVTNGMVIPPKTGRLGKMNALGVSQYGQMIGFLYVHRTARNCARYHHHSTECVS
jgi:hypothetical protein